MSGLPWPASFLSDLKNWRAMEPHREADVSSWSPQPNGDVMGRGILLWMLGIPIPVLLLLWAFGVLH
ncbi:MAG TPA: hypothetical protein VMH36_26875 [Alphaproteobacteria bacterium]|nr:hypothetical protein [Alphaproteobacteria bacterium]